MVSSCVHWFNLYLASVNLLINVCYLSWSGRLRTHTDVQWSVQVDSCSGEYTGKLMRKRGKERKVYVCHWLVILSSEVKLNSINFTIIYWCKCVIHMNEFYVFLWMFTTCVWRNGQSDIICNKISSCVTWAGDLPGHWTNVKRLTSLFVWPTGNVFFLFLKPAVMRKIKVCGVLIKRYHLAYR